MSDSLPKIESWKTSDDYPIHVASWPTTGPPRATVVVLHGVQSHGGWYHSLGKVVSESGFEVHFPDRRGSGANTRDRGDTPSPGRLVLDIAEYLLHLREADTKIPIVLCGISWGCKLAVLTAGRYPDRVQGLVLICPGLHAKVGVPFREKLKVAWAYFTNLKKRFPIPLSDPALFTESESGKQFIAKDPLGLRDATAGLLAASLLIDRSVARTPTRIHQPSLLMTAGDDRIVDNAKTVAFFNKFASKTRRTINYLNAHHTLEFEPDPELYARDLSAWISSTLLV